MRRPAQDRSGIRPGGRQDWLTESVPGRNPMTISIQQIHSLFAGEVRDIDCAHPLSDAEVAAIKAGMDEYGVLVVPRSGTI